MIRLNNVVASYKTQRGVVNAVDGVNIEIPDGIILGIAGESGCGKSTLMKVIYGDIGFPLSLSSGTVDYGFKDERGNEVTSANIQKQ
ncbi:MAG TPA: ATP-binding cassette domain-containing protein, partial [Chloroflexia bacterium]|nr:ATP-binding cassette domain-containing protein [Chloroflexia bacterium]